MRLYNENEETTKKIVVEDYSTFKNILQSKWLFYLLIAYTAYVVINTVLAILDGGYIMGAIDAVVHGFVCASLWLFRKANLQNSEAKFSVKGIKMFQIAHAVKYLVVFVLFVLVLIMIVLGWINSANDAKQAYVAVQDSVDLAKIAAAKAVKVKVFWSYLGLLIGYLVFTVLTCVYYKAVMCFADGISQYCEKGKHCWEDLKYLGNYLFVAAGLTIVIGLVAALGGLDNIFAMILNTNFALFTGGLGFLSFIGRVIFAGLCVCMGLVCLKGYHILSTTETAHEEIVEINDQTITTNVTE